MRNSKQDGSFPESKRNEPCEFERAESDYRTFNAENIRLPGETTIDKCVRVATWLRTHRSNGNLSLDLPNPELPQVYDEIDIQTYKAYLRVIEALAWLEVAAIRTYRKSKKNALHRLYSNLEKESGVQQKVFRDIRQELTRENVQFLSQVSDCILRDPIYNPREASLSRRRMIQRIDDNVVRLRVFSEVKSKKKNRAEGKQQKLKL